MVAASRSPRFATLMFGALFIYVVGMMFGMPTLFFMSAALAIVPAVSYALAAVGLRDIEAERRLSSRLWPDERVEVELRLINHNWLPKCLLHIDEDLPAGLTGDPADPPGCVIPMLWGDTYCHRYPLIANQRGRYVLPPVVTTAVDTFDLFRARRRTGPANEIVVYPRRVPLNNHVLHAPALDGLIQRHRPLATGTDFRATREYLPGDDLRRVHWRSTARRGKPIVVEFEEPASTDLFVVLDTSGEGVQGDAADNSFETGVTLVASLVEHELERSNAIGLLLDTDPPCHLPLTRERHDRLRFFEALAVVATGPGRPFAATVQAAAELVPSSAVVLLVTASTSPALHGAVAHLVRHHAVALAWLDPAGYPGVDGADGGAFLSGLRPLGVAPFRIIRDDLAGSLARAV